MRARRTVIGMLVAAICAVALPAHGASAVTSCHNLVLPAKTKTAWLAAYKRTRHLEGVTFSLKRVPGALGARYYGRCGGTYWGRSDFDLVPGQHLTEKQQVDLQDGPDVFRRTTGHRWRDVSDSGGGTPCGGRVGFPRALVRAWGISCG